jgi:hypothetical protein
MPTLFPLLILHQEVQTVISAFDSVRNKGGNSLKSKSRNKGQSVLKDQ